MLCKNCLKCIIIKSDNNVVHYICEVSKMECFKDTIECNRNLPRNRLNTFSTEHNI
jgi:hypothetical protein